MSKVRAKFSCNTITLDGYGKTVSLSAVYDKEGENADFAKATPSGKIEMRIDGGVPASEFFNPQKRYYVYFEEAPMS
jgi:hypothetical protein